MVSQVSSAQVSRGDEVGGSRCLGSMEVRHLQSQLHSLGCMVKPWEPSPAVTEEDVGPR